MAEMIDLYNRQRHPLNRTAERGETLPSGCYHVIVTGWIESAKGAFLMARRKPGDGIAGGVEDDQIGLPVALAGQDQRLRVLDGHVGDARIANDDGGRRRRDAQDTRHVDLDAYRIARPRLRGHGRRKHGGDREGRNQALEVHGGTRSVDTQPASSFAPNGEEMENGTSTANARKGN